MLDKHYIFHDQLWLSFKAAIKKVTEKLNEILVEKIEEATNIAQDAPEILKKEFDDLKKSIIEEASRMEKAQNIQENEPTYNSQNSQIKNTLNEIKDINRQIDLLNQTMNNQIKWVITFFMIVLKNWRGAFLFGRPWFHF